MIFIQKLNDRGTRLQNPFVCQKVELNNCWVLLRKKSEKLVLLLV